MLEFVAGAIIGFIVGKGLAPQVIAKIKELLTKKEE
jgi:hypothetical protein